MITSLAADRLDNSSSNPVSKNRKSMKARIGKQVMIWADHNWTFLASF